VLEVRWVARERSHDEVELSFQRRRLFYTIKTKSNVESVPNVFGRTIYHGNPFFHRVRFIDRCHRKTALSRGAGRYPSPRYFCSSLGQEIFIYNHKKFAHIITSSHINEVEM
jgi:hypothetical protein